MAIPDAPGLPARRYSNSSGGGIPGGDLTSVGMRPRQNSGFPGFPGLPNPGQRDQRVGTPFGPTNTNATSGQNSGSPSSVINGGRGILNTAQKDPRIEQVQGQMNSRYNTLAGQEGKMDPFLQESINSLRGRQSTNTSQRAMDQANASAADQAAGLQSRMDSQAARSGHGAGFGGQAITGAAQRLGAKQSAQIQMNELGRQDALTLGGQGILQAPSQLGLAQQGQTNNFLLGSAGLANQGANNALAQQGLGLQQYGMGLDANYKQALLNQGGEQFNANLQSQNQQNMFNNYLRLLGTQGNSGY